MARLVHIIDIIVVVVVEVEQLTELRRSVVVEVIIFDYNNIFDKTRI